MLRKFFVAAAVMIASLALADQPTRADNDANVSATAGLERYAPASHPSTSKDIDASAPTNAASSALPDLDATRAAIDSQTGSNIQLNVSGWVSQQVQINR